MKIPVMKPVSVTAVVCILFTFLVLQGAGLAAEGKTLDIYWIDVEGGAATLVVTPAGESVLVDAGQDLERDISRIHHVVTKVAGLQSIDHFVATHWHADHYGGIMTLSERIPVKNFYDRGEVPSQLPEDPSFMSLMPRYQKMTAGKAIGLKPGSRVLLRPLSDKTPLTLLCLASSGKMVAGAKGGPLNSICSKGNEPARDETDNAKSVVLKLQYGSFTFFDGGDLTQQMEERLVCPSNRVGTTTLLQIDHHGLDLSNNSVWLRTLRPQVVIVNNGPDKGAETETLKNLKKLPGLEAIWQVHRNLRGGEQANASAEFIANYESACKAEFIKASVRPDATFTVQIGSRNGREYKTR
jgi:competence protein ComEC